MRILIKLDIVRHLKKQKFRPQIYGGILGNLVLKKVSLYTNPARQHIFHVC